MTVIISSISLPAFLPSMKLHKQTNPRARDGESRESFFFFFFWKPRTLLLAYFGSLNYSVCSRHFIPKSSSFRVQYTLAFGTRRGKISRLTNKQGSCETPCLRHLFSNQQLWLEGRRKEEGEGVEEPQCGEMIALNSFFLYIFEAKKPIVLFAD